MKKIYLSLFFMVIFLSMNAQQWAGPNNTTSLISRTGEIETSLITIKRENSPMVSLIKNDLSINGGSVIGQINFRGPNHWGGLIVARSVGAWGSNSNQAGTKLEFWTQDNTVNSNLSAKMIINHDGKVGIGTTKPDMKLTVKGNIHAEEVKIDLNVPAPDYVFKKEYTLRSIDEVENFIKENSHLPEIPSAKEFEQNGLMLAKMDMDLLKKIEELTLYTIQQQKEIERLKLLENRLAEIEKLLDSKK